MEKITSFKHNCMIIRILMESIDIRGNLYEAVRRCWRTDINRARKADYVMAVVGTIKERNLEVQAVYKPERWYYPDDGFCRKKEKECIKGYKVATDLCHVNRRIAFEGKEMPNDTNYLHKLIPEKYFPLQNPVRYTYNR